ncbi:MAG: ATP synthase F0 subunit A [Parcubacteria group bacterium 21-54-25]|nr:MAG: ATP synthase F0 subunit A [Parcubacteria group bacterium 21-54-25]HQU07661.1 F0F1 ATP synthase subunit A [Candidatus Paceibacterota bacterium]
MNSGIHVILKAEQLGSFFGLPITNSLLMTWVLMALLIAGAYFFRRRLALRPGKLQAGVEWVFERSFAYTADLFESEELARRFFPLLATIFLFVLIANELEFFPGVGSIGLMQGTVFVPLLRTPTTDLNVTLALAIISFLTIEVTGILTFGVLKYGKKFINFASPLGFVVGLIELVSNLGRLVSFSFRLFGNIFAGEILVLVAGYFLPYILPAPLMGFEMFIGIIQALVFAMLTLFFIKLAIMEPHGAHA